MCTLRCTDIRHLPANQKHIFSVAMTQRKKTRMNISCLMFSSLLHVFRLHSMRGGNMLSVTCAAACLRLAARRPGSGVGGQCRVQGRTVAASVWWASSQVTAECKHLIVGLHWSVKLQINRGVRKVRIPLHPSGPGAVWMQRCLMVNTVSREGRSVYELIN